MRFSQSPRDRDLRFLALSAIERNTAVLEWSLHCRGEGVLMPVLSTVPCMSRITDFGLRLVKWRSSPLHSPAHPRPFTSHFVARAVNSGEVWVREREREREKGEVGCG